MSGDPRTYCLLIKKERAGELQIGRLGLFNFPQGYYVYTGSAKRGLQARINRHLSREKKLRWHVDYLLEESVIEKVFLSEKEECELSKRIFSIPGAAIVAKKFGSSDCSCSSHLAYFADRPAIPVSKTWRTRYTN